MFTSKIVHQGLSHATQQLQHTQTQIEKMTEHFAQTTDQLIEFNSGVAHRALDLTVKTSRGVVQHTLGQAVQACERMTERLQTADTADLNDSSELVRSNWSEQTQQWVQQYMEGVWNEENLHNFLSRIPNLNPSQLIDRLGQLLGQTSTVVDREDEDKDHIETVDQSEDEMKVDETVDPLTNSTETTEELATELGDPESVHQTQNLTEESEDESVESHHEDEVKGSDAHGVVE